FQHFAPVEIKLRAWATFQRSSRSVLVRIGNRDDLLATATFDIALALPASADCGNAQFLPGPKSRCRCTQAGQRAGAGSEGRIIKELTACYRRSSPGEIFLFHKNFLHRDRQGSKCKKMSKVPISEWPGSGCSFANRSQYLLDRFVSWLRSQIALAV